jgi:hypothetical protein
MLDPLSISITTAGVETSLPLLPEADYIMQVSESSIDPNKDNNGLNWNLKLVTTTETTSTDGRTVKPNFPVYTVSALQAREDSKDKEAFIRGLGQNIDAIFGTDKTTRPDFNKALADAALGKTVIAHVIIDTYQGRQNNKIKALKPFAG